MRAGDDIDVEVDGGLDVHTVAGAVHAGANVIVAGSALYRDPDGLEHAVTELRAAAETARRATDAAQAEPVAIAARLRDRAGQIVDLVLDGTVAAAEHEHRPRDGPAQHLADRERVRRRLGSGSAPPPPPPRRTSWRDRSCSRRPRARRRRPRTAGRCSPRRSRRAPSGPAASTGAPTYSSRHRLSRPADLASRITGDSSAPATRRSTSATSFGAGETLGRRVHRGERRDVARIVEVDRLQDGVDGAAERGAAPTQRRRRRTCGSRRAADARLDGFELVGLARESGGGPDAPPIDGAERRARGHGATRRARRRSSGRTRGRGTSTGSASWSAMAASRHHPAAAS